MHELPIYHNYDIAIYADDYKVIRDLACGNSLSWLLNLNLTYQTLWNVAFSDAGPMSTFLNLVANFHKFS